MYINYINLRYMYTYIVCMCVYLLLIQFLWRTLSNTLLILSFRSITSHPHTQHKFLE